MCGVGGFGGFGKGVVGWWYEGRGDGVVIGAAEEGTKRGAGGGRVAPLFPLLEFEAKLDLEGVR